jgi:hypothetical protein
LVKSHPVPYVGVPFQPKLGHKHTVPFTFEEREKEKLHRKEEKISEILEEERQVELYAGLVFF